MERVNENDLGYRNGDHGVKYLIRGPRFEWGVILLRPGDTLSPHRHAAVEETFFFESGSPLLYVAGQPYRVRAGDAFRLDPTETHRIENDTEEPARLVFIKCPYLPDDKEDVPE